MVPRAVALGRSAQNVRKQRWRRLSGAPGPGRNRRQQGHVFGHRPRIPHPFSACGRRDASRRVPATGCPARSVGRELPPQNVTAQQLPRSGVFYRCCHLRRLPRRSPTGRLSSAVFSVVGADHQTSVLWTLCSGRLGALSAGAGPGRRGETARKKETGRLGGGRDVAAG